MQEQADHVRVAAANMEIVASKGHPRTRLAREQMERNLAEGRAPDGAPRIGAAHRPKKEPDKRA